MANIKIAQLTNKTTLADTDIVIVESATATEKMTVAKLKELLFHSPHLTGYPVMNGLETNHYTRVGEGAGAGIFPSFSNAPQIGFLYVVEKGTDKYLVATLFKASTTSIVFASPIAFNGLSISATNAGGTVSVTGFTNGANAVFTAVANLLGKK